MNDFELSIAIIYILLMILIGIIASRKSRSKEQMYLAGNTFSWFPLGISVMISAFSAVNFIAFPSEIIEFGPAVLISLPVFILVLYPLIKWFIPFFTKQKGLSAYSFLEERYDIKTKYLAMLLFIMWRLMWISITLYASARLLMVFTGWPLHIIMIVIGIIAIFYSSIGGFRAVVITDMVQFFILLGTISLTLYLAMDSDSFSIASFTGWFSDNPFPNDFFSFDPKIRISFWSGLTGTFIAFLARYGADQISIQRYMAARSDKEAGKLIVLNSFAVLSILTLLLLWGIAVSLVYENSPFPPLKQMALFIGSMPTGMTGLFTAALIAASMSSIDSGLNAMSAVISEELKLKGSIKKEKLGTMILGLFSLSGALLLIPVMEAEGSIFVVANKIIHGFGAPILSLIVIGIFSKRIKSFGAFWGTCMGALSSIASVIIFDDLAVHAYVVINLSISLSASYFISILFCKNSE